MPPKYLQSSIDSARETTSELCEKVLAKVTLWKRVKRWNNRWHDLLLKDWLKLEAKVGRLWNSAVIKQNQLFDFDADLWGFLFYRTIGNFPPSFYTSQERKISAKEYLLRNISIVWVYIFPTQVMKYHWNTTSVQKWTISTTWINHKPFAISRANQIMIDENIPGLRQEKGFKYGRHEFPVKTIDFKL